MKTRILTLILLLFLDAACAFAQADRHEVRRGNRLFGKENWKEAELSYRKALVKDSLSVAGRYNLASALYRQENFEGAREVMQSFEGQEMSSDQSYNAGDIKILEGLDAVRMRPASVFTRSRSSLALARRRCASWMPSSSFETVFLSCLTFPFSEIVLMKTSTITTKTMRGRSVVMVRLPSLFMSPVASAIAMQPTRSRANPAVSAVII